MEVVSLTQVDKTKGCCIPSRAPTTLAEIDGDIAAEHHTGNALMLLLITGLGRLLRC